MPPAIRRQSVKSVRFLESNALASMDDSRVGEDPLDASLMLRAEIDAEEEVAVQDLSMLKVFFFFFFFFFLARVSFSRLFLSRWYLSAE